MASKLAFIGGGLLEGVGRGLVLSGKQKREEALKRIEQEGADKRMAGKEQFERLMAEFEQENRLELEGVKQGNRQGLLTQQLQSDLGLAEIREAGAGTRTAATIAGAGERRTAASRSAENVAKITAGSRKAVAEIAAGKATDTSAAEKRAFDILVKIHTVADENGLEATDWNAVAEGLNEKGFGKLAGSARSRGKGIADLEVRKRAEQFADQMVKEQSGAFSTDASDFKDDSGSRTRFRARMVREYIAKNGGAAAEAPATRPAVADDNPYVGATPPRNHPDAKQANDGFWYIQRDGKFLRVQNSEENRASRRGRGRGPR